MNDWLRMLREHDPARGASLPPEVAAAMRRRVVAAAPRATAPSWWWQSIGVAAMVVMMIVAGLVVGRSLPEPVESAVAADRAADAMAGRRQLQFATPGGTRIIWVFNPEFDSNGTTP